MATKIKLFEDDFNPALYQNGGTRLDIELPMTRRVYRITGISDILGSQPINPDVHSAYVASKAPIEQLSEIETDALPDLDEKGVTVFLRNPKTGALCIRPYVLRGYFKESLASLKEANGIGNVKSKVDRLLFIRPSYFIDFQRDGEPILDCDEWCERPLRAQTMQGERSALARSELIRAGWQLTFEVQLLANNGTKASKSVVFDAVEQALAYGQMQGLGQWRNGGNGRFITERLD